MVTWFIIQAYTKINKIVISSDKYKLSEINVRCGLLVVKDLVPTALYEELVFSVIYWYSMTHIVFADKMQTNSSSRIRYVCILFHGGKMAANPRHLL